MKQEQDNHCYLFTLASTNKATLARLKTLHTTLFTQSIYFSYCFWTCTMIMAIAWTAFLLAWLKLHCCWRCCIVKTHITCIVVVVFCISLNLTNCEYCSKHDQAKRKKLPVTDVLWYSSWA